MRGCPHKDNNKTGHQCRKRRLVLSPPKVQSQVKRIVNSSRKKTGVLVSSEEDCNNYGLVSYPISLRYARTIKDCIRHL